MASLSRTELPEEIEKAIEALCVVERRNGGTFFGSERGRTRREEEATEARSALTAAILSRLGEAEARREEALKELHVAWLTHSAAVTFRDERDAALARVERLEKAAQATPPDGWVLVPKELTRAMLDVVSKQVDDFSREHTRLFTRDLWADLIASAPQVRPKESSDG